MYSVYTVYTTAACVLCSSYTLKMHVDSVYSHYMLKPDSVLLIHIRVLLLYVSYETYDLILY